MAIYESILFLIIIIALIVLIYKLSKQNIQPQSTIKNLYYTNGDNISQKDSNGSFAGVKGDIRIKDNGYLSISEQNILLIDKNNLLTEENKRLKEDLILKDVVIKRLCKMKESLEEERDKLEKIIDKIA